MGDKKHRPLFKVTEFQDGEQSKLVAHVGWLHNRPGVVIRRYLPKKNKPGEWRVSKVGLDIPLEHWGQFCEMVDALDRTIKREKQRGL